MKKTNRPDMDVYEKFPLWDNKQRVVGVIVYFRNGENYYCMRADWRAANTDVRVFKTEAALLKDVEVTRQAYVERTTEFDPRKLYYN